MKNLEKLLRKQKRIPQVEISQSAYADQKKVKEFYDHECKYTRKNNPITGSIGGATTYRFTPTTLGTVIKLQCGCGKEVDVTDYDW